MTLTELAILLRRERGVEHGTHTLVPDATAHAQVDVVEVGILEVPERLPLANPHESSTCERNRSDC